MRIARLARASVVGALAVCVVAGLGGCGDAHRSGPPRPDAFPRSAPAFPSTYNGIGLGLAFDYHAHDTGAISRHVSYIFGGVFGDWNTGVDPAVGHDDGYLQMDTDPFPPGISGHSLAYWERKHPDWIVYRCDRRTPAYYGSGDANVPLDFSNPAVRDYQMHMARLLFGRGATGIAFDDFSFANFEGRCGVYRHGVWTPLGYPGRGEQNAKYGADVMSWLRNISEQLHERFPTKSLALNMNLFASGPDKVRLVAPYVDMVFDEGGFTQFGAGPVSGHLWQETVDGLEYLAAHDKAYDINEIVNARDDASVSPAQIDWVLANYLLVNGGHSYTYIYAGNGKGSVGSPSGYGAFYDRPQYHIPIGHPTSRRFAAFGAQLRYYSGGLVIVNPSSSHTANVSLAAPYRDMFGNRYATTVTLAPTSATVLLNGFSPRSG